MGGGEEILWACGHFAIFCELRFTDADCIVQDQQHVGEPFSVWNQCKESFWVSPRKEDGNSQVGAPAGTAPVFSCGLVRTFL